MKVLKPNFEKERAKEEVSKDLFSNIDNLKTLPPAAVWMNASSKAKRIYKEIGNHLLETKKLKAFDTYALLMLSVALEQYAWAVGEIEKNNKTSLGSGYVQTYSTGAKNITAELVVRKEAYKQILELAGKFGLTLRDRITMEKGKNPNPNQLNLNEQLFSNFSFDVSAS